MKEAIVTQFLIDITRGHLKDAYAENRESVIAKAPLPTLMRDAVQSKDVAALWLAGVSPMALLYFSRMEGWSMEQYYRCISEAELKKVGRVDSDQLNQPSPRQKNQ